MTHEDEARRIVEKLIGCSTLDHREEAAIAEIAAALAAAERGGIERAADAANERLTHCHPVLEDRLGSCRACEQAHVERRIRALLPAEPAAGCATCGGAGVVRAECPDKVSGTGMYAAPGISCAVMHYKPCPACAGGGA